jgi:hypothetical protein
MRKLVLLLATFVAFSATAQEDPVDDTVIRTDSTTTSTVTTKSDTNLKSPPPSAITPTINTSNSDLCTFGVAGAVQTQILGISMGSQITDANCERLKLSKTLYDMGMKVAAVSTLCQDERVFNAMLMAGTPCNETTKEEEEKGLSDGTKTIIGSAGVASLLLLLLL